MAPEYYINPDTLKPYIALDNLFELLDEMASKTNGETSKYIDKVRISMKEQFTQSLANYHFKQLGL